MIASILYSTLHVDGSHAALPNASLEELSNTLLGSLPSGYVIDVYAAFMYAHHFSVCDADFVARERTDRFDAVHEISRKLTKDLVCFHRKYMHTNDFIQTKQRYTQSIHDPCSISAML